MTPWTKTWRKVELRKNEPYRLTSTVGAFTAGPFATVTKWEPFPWSRIKAFIREHLRPQLLRVGDMHEVRAYRRLSQEDVLQKAEGLVEQALVAHRQECGWYTVPVLRVFFGGKIRRLSMLSPLPILTVEAEPAQRSRIVHLLAQVCILSIYA